MAADETKLGALHDKVAEVLSMALDGEELPGYTDKTEDEDGNIIEIEVPPKRLPASAAILAVAAKFLKDNQITCAPSKDNQLGELEAKLARRTAAKAGKADPVDLGAASEHASFLSRLPLN